MKILHVADYLPDYHQKWGGAEQACLRLVHLLQNSNQDIAVISSKPLKGVGPNHACSFVYTLESCLPDFLKHLYQRVNSIISFDPLVFIQFCQIILKKRPELIHLHNIQHLSCSVIYSAKIFRVPLVISVYDYWYFCPKATLQEAGQRLCLKFHGFSCLSCLGLSRWLGYLLVFRKMIFNFFLSRINAFIVLSQSSAEILRLYGIAQEKINLIYLPAPFERISDKKESSLTPDKPFLLFIGGLSFNKGAHIVIEALADIKREFPDIGLYIVGAVSVGADSGYIDKLNQAIKLHKLEQAVTFLEKVSPVKAQELINESAAVIIPEQWHNMSPLILMEAMLLARPIVASRIGGITEFIQDGQNGFLATPDSAPEFAQKIIRILQYPEQANTVSAKARLDAQKIWNNDLTLKQIGELYERLSK